MSDEHRLSELRRKMQKHNHPAKGSAIKVEPIRDVSAIMAIKMQLKDQPRNACLFTLGINTAYRAGELLSLCISDVADLGIGDGLEIKQHKNNKYRRTSLNRTAYQAIQLWLDVHPKPEPSASLFLSLKGGALGVSATNHLVKRWCKDAGLQGNYGSHTLRKTWGYQQRIILATPISLLMRAFGHSSEMQTLEYLCIQPEEIGALYMELEL